MKAAAIIVAGAAGICLAAALWLLLKTLRFYLGDSYARHAGSLPGVEADGGGIFLPAALLLGIGLFLLRFAWNLWRDRG
jgi:hypothetical protein